MILKVRFIISLSTRAIKECLVNFEYFQLDVLWYALLLLILLLPNIILFMTCVTNITRNVLISTMMKQ
jgi:hypothetical protein